MKNNPESTKPRRNFRRDALASPQARSAVLLLSEADGHVIARLHNHSANGMVVELPRNSHTVTACLTPSFLRVFDARKSTDYRKAIVRA